MYGLVLIYIYKFGIIYLDILCTCHLHQECASKASQLWSGKHAFLHHHRWKGASSHLLLYLSKWMKTHRSFAANVRTCYYGYHCLQALRRTGLHPSDPRLKDCMEKLRQAVKESAGEVMMDRDLFHRQVTVLRNNLTSQIYWSSS